MPLWLSFADLAQLEAATTTLLAPPAHPTPDASSAAILRDVRPLPRDDHM